jgi:hypothetical protein
VTLAAAGVPVLQVYTVYPAYPLTIEASARARVTFFQVSGIDCDFSAAITLTNPARIAVIITLSALDHGQTGEVLSLYVNQCHCVRLPF